MTTTKYITVVNNFNILNSALLQSLYLDKNDVIIMDNTINNKPISHQYNNTIKSILESDLNLINHESTWLVFCHQDFYIGENLSYRLKYLDKNCIYGPIGAKAYSKHLLGKILQTNNIPIGSECNECIVDTLDAMCLIVNLEIITKYNLLFDENLKYHFYAEDFCLQAKNKGIPTKTLQMDCQHRSRTLSGDITSEEYLNSKEIITKKWESRLSEWGPIKTSTGYIGDNPESDRRNALIIGGTAGIIILYYVLKKK